MIDTFPDFGDFPTGHLWAIGRYVAFWGHAVPNNDMSITADEILLFPGWILILSGEIPLRF